MNKSKRKSQNQPTACQESLPYGIVLGDTYITFRGNLQIEQALHKKEDVDWLFTQLRSLTTGKGPSLVTGYDKWTKQQYFGYHFSTRNVSCNWRSLFYDENRKKRLTSDFGNRLDALA